MSDRHVDITVKQNASDEELAVIVAAVEYLQSQERIGDVYPPRRSRWAEAARRESLRDVVRPFKPLRT